MKRLSSTNIADDTDLNIKRGRSFDWQSVPEEIWLNIFSFLSVTTVCGTLRKVCRSWHRLSHDRVVWSKLVLPERYTLTEKMLDDLFQYNDLTVVKDFAYFPIDLLDEVILKFTTIDQNINSLLVNKCFRLSNSGAYNLAKMTNLEHLHLRNCYQIADETFATVLKQLFRLKSLHIDGNDISDVILNAIAKLKYLTDLQLKVLDRTTADGFRNMLGNLKLLTNLDLDFFDFDRNPPVIRSTVKCLVYLQCKNLAKLGLTNLRGDCDSIIRKIFLNNKSLKYLKLRSCDVSGSFIFGPHNLKKLTLSHCDCLQKSFFSYFRSNGLDELYVTINSHYAFEMNFLNVNRLSLEINVWPCNNISKVTSLTSENVLFLSLPLLYKQETLEFVLKNCKTLKKLSINVWWFLTTDDVPFTKNFSITEFYGEFDNVSDLPLKIALALPNLCQADFSINEEVMIPLLRLLDRNCPYLHSVNVHLYCAEWAFDATVLKQFPNLEINVFFLHYPPKPDT